MPLNEIKLNESVGLIVAFDKLITTGSAIPMEALCSRARLVEDQTALTTT